MVIYIYIYVYFVWYSIHNKCRYLSLLHVDSYFIKLSVKTGCDPTFGHERNRIKIIIIIIKKGLHVKTALEHFKNLQRAPNISETSLTTWLLLSGRGTQVHPELRWCKAAYSFNSSVETHTHTLGLQSLRLSIILLLYELLSTRLHSAFSFSAFSTIVIFFYEKKSTCSPHSEQELHVACRFGDVLDIKSN